MNSTMQRPTIAAVKACAIKNIDIPHFCPVTKNKGAAGLLFEKLAEIPTSSACLDCFRWRGETLSTENIEAW